MSTACDAVRARLVAGGDAAEHLSACAACRAFSASLARVDRSLAAAADAAAASPLPPLLRARIVAASRGASPRADGTRGRLLDLALRAAAVAAVLVGGMGLLPQPLLAADAELTDLRMPSLGLSDAISDRIASLPRFAEAPPVEVPVGSAPLAVAAAAFLGGAWIVTRARGSR